MKRILLFLLACCPMLLCAQEDNSKYLAGAVPVVNGKVIFTEVIQASDMSKRQIYDALLKWAEKRFTPSKGQKGRVAYFEEKKGQIACLGEEYLQLSATNSFFLDRATIKYRLVINCLDGSCKMEMYNISYFHGDDTEMEAEDWITDETGLNKAKTKVVAKYGKLRIKTIDLFDDLTEQVTKTLGGANQRFLYWQKNLKLLRKCSIGNFQRLWSRELWQGINIFLLIRFRVISLKCSLKIGC